MDQRELREMVEEFFRENYRPWFDPPIPADARVGELSDEEWYRHSVVLTLIKSPSSEPATFDDEELRNACVTMRHRHGPEHDTRNAADSIAADLNRLTQSLMVDRTSLEPPLTREELSAASQRASRHESDALLDKFDHLSQLEINPNRRAYLNQFVANARLDTAELAELNSSDVTEEKIAEVTARIVARMQQLTDSLKKPPE